MLSQAIFILEVYAYLVVAVTCKSRSLHFAPLIWSSHAGLSILRTQSTYSIRLQCPSRQSTSYEIVSIQPAISLAVMASRP